MRGSYAYPWAELSEQQQTARCDEVLRYTERFCYIAARDVYRVRGATPGSPDYAPADAVETRRRSLEDKSVATLEIDRDLCELCFGAGWYEDPVTGVGSVTCVECNGSGAASHRTEGQ
jgi:hypothetical protein